MKHFIYEYTEVVGTVIYFFMKTTSINEEERVGTNLIKNTFLYIHLNKDLLDDNVFDILIELYLFLPLHWNPFIQVTYSLYKMEDLLQPEINAIHFLQNRRREFRTKKNMVKADQHLAKFLEETKKQRKQKGTVEAELPNENKSGQVKVSGNTMSLENSEVWKRRNGNTGSSNKNATTSKKKPRWKWMAGEIEGQWQLNLMLSKLENKINEKICAYTQWWKKMKSTSIILANEKYKMYTTLGEYLSKDIIESLIFVCKKYNWRKLDSLLFILMPCRSIHGKVLKAYRNYYDYMKNVMAHRYFRICKVWTKNQRILLQKWDTHRMNFVAELVAKHSSDEYSGTVENILHHLNRQSYRFPKKKKTAMK